MVIWTCLDRLLAIMGYIRGEWDSLPYAARPFIYAHRIFYMDSRKYRNVFWGLGIPKPNRYMESRSFRKSEFMALVSDCQLSYSSDVKTS